MAKTHDRDLINDDDEEEFAWQGSQLLRVRPRRALGTADPEPQTEADLDEPELLDYTFVESGEGGHRSIKQFLRHVDRLKRIPFRGHRRRT